MRISSLNPVARFWLFLGPEKGGLTMNNECITGLSPRGHCGSAAYCPEPYDCCAKCKKDCNIRCGHLPDRKEPEKEVDHVDPDKL